MYKVKPPNNGCNGTCAFVLLMEVVLCSEVNSSIEEFNVYDKFGTKVMIYLCSMHAYMIIFIVMG